MTNMRKFLLPLALLSTGLAFALFQSCNDDVKTPEDKTLTLTLDVAEVESEKATIKVTASDNENTWFANYVPKSEYKDDKFLINADMADFYKKAQEQGCSLADVISTSVFRGNRNIEFPGLNPGTGYYAYVYSLNEEGVCGDVIKKEFTTAFVAAPEVELSFSMLDITFDMAKIKVTASDETTWFAGCVLKSEYTDDGALVSADIERMKKTAQEQGKSLAEIISTSAYSGNRELLFTRLDSETDYYVYAYGINTHALAGKVYKDEFTTGKNNPYADVKPGDFYMNNGTIVPGGSALSAKQIENCLGIVVYVGDAIWNEDVYLQREYPACSHGAVLSIKNITEICVWDVSLGNDIADWVQNSFNDWIKGFDYDANTLLQGFGETFVVNAYMKSTSCNLPPFKALAAFNEKIPTPEGTSTWYIPSLKEFAYISSGEIVDTSEENVNDGDEFKTDFAESLNVFMEKAQGDSIIDKFWASASCTGSLAWYFDFTTGKPCYNMKYIPTAYTRAMFAF